MIIRPVGLAAEAETAPPLRSQGAQCDQSPLCADLDGDAENILFDFRLSVA